MSRDQHISSRWKTVCLISSRSRGLKYVDNNTQKSILHGCKVSQYNLERQGNYKYILALERYPLELGVTYQSNTKYYQSFMISEDKTDNYSQQTLNSQNRPKLKINRRSNFHLLATHIVLFKKKKEKKKL